MRCFATGVCGGRQQEGELAPNVNQSSRKNLHMGSGLGVSRGHNRSLTNIPSQKLESQVRSFRISDVPWRAIAFAIIALMLGGCMQGTLAPVTEAGWNARDRQLMSNLPYAGDNSGGVQASHRPVHAQGSSRHHRGRYRQQVSLLRAAEGPGDPLRHHRRRRLPSLEWHRHGWPQGGMAVVDTDRRRTRAAWAPPGLREWRAAKSDGRARPISLLWRQRHAVPYPRHQPARIYRPSHLLRLHPHDQRGRDRSLQSRQNRHDCRCPRANVLVIRTSISGPQRVTSRSTHIMVCLKLNEMNPCARSC